MNYIINQEQKYKEYKAPYIPKSKALDKLGFSQRKILALIKKENLYETAVQFKKLLLNINNIEGSQYLIHNTLFLIMSFCQIPPYLLYI